jgi:hypothetical protein
MTIKTIHEYIYTCELQAPKLGDSQYLVEHAIESKEETVKGRTAKGVELTSIQTLSQ